MAGVMAELKRNSDWYYANLESFVRKVDGWAKGQIRKAAKSHIGK